MSQVCGTTPEAGARQVTVPGPIAGLPLIAAARGGAKDSNSTVAPIMPSMSRYAQGVGVDILCWADFSSRESLLSSNWVSTAVYTHHGTAVCVHTASTAAAVVRVELPCTAVHVYTHHGSYRSRGEFSTRNFTGQAAVISHTWKYAVPKHMHRGKIKIIRACAAHARTHAVVAATAAARACRQQQLASKRASKAMASAAMLAMLP